MVRNSGGAFLLLLPLLFLLLFLLGGNREKVSYLKLRNQNLETGSEFSMCVFYCRKLTLKCIWMGDKGAKERWDQMSKELCP